MSEVSTESKSPTTGRVQIILLSALLLLLTLGLFLPSLKCDFVNYDDDVYVTSNQEVQRGLTLENVRWAFGDVHIGFYHPLTLLSHSVAFQLFGLKPAGHHFINLLLHSLNAVLVFLLFKKITGATWRSFFVGLFFGIHPLRVESVTWIAERKDVLSGFFFLLALLFYARYVEIKERRDEGSIFSLRRPIPNYVLSLSFFTMALFSKPLVVILPFVLLLLDFWPLQRKTSHLSKLVLEKIPFFVLSAVISLITFSGHKEAGVLHMTTKLPLVVRVDNALISYCRYLEKIFVPVKLAVLYPHPGNWPKLQVFLAGVLLLAISVFVVMRWKPQPFLAIGWFWFLGILVPAIGLVQAGVQAMADRYTYLPSIGLLVFVVWSVDELTRGWRLQRILSGAFAATLSIICLSLTREQLRYWKNTESLFRHALATTANNAVMHHALGEILAATPQRLPEAIDHYQTALRIDPENALTHYNLGSALAKTHDRLPEAIAEYETALRLKPDYAAAHNNLGIALAELGKLQEAIVQFEEALRLDPVDAPTHINLGIALVKTNRLQEATSHYETALKLNPEDTIARFHLGSVLVQTAERLPEAIALLESVLGVHPDHANSHYFLALALTRTGGKSNEAMLHFKESLRLNPNNAAARRDFGIALEKIPERLPDAITELKESARISPDDPITHLHLAEDLEKTPDQLEAAIWQYQEALHLDPGLLAARRALGRLRPGQLGESP